MKPSVLRFHTHPLFRLLACFGPALLMVGLLRILPWEAMGSILGHAGIRVMSLVGHLGDAIAATLYAWFAFALTSTGLTTHAVLALGCGCFLLKNEDHPDVPRWLLGVSALVGFFALLALLSAMIAIHPLT
jgi:hypothetical protein